MNFRFGLAALGFCLLATEPALAFCRATTCDPGSESCPTDEDGCLTTGIPLKWPGRCVSFGIQRDGSPKLGITAQLFHDLVEDALESWRQADCGGSAPAIDTRPNAEFIECSETLYNSDAANANVWMFQDDVWPYDTQENAIALTTTTYSLKTGDIYDADVELNSRDVTLTLDDEDVVVDLQSTIIHEAGHFLGLAHSPIATATMQKFYVGVEARSLDEDDEAGICAIYPPDSSDRRCSFEPRHGFSTDCAGPANDADEQDDATCNCRAAGSSSRGPNFGVGLVLALALLAIARRGR